MAVPTERMPDASRALEEFVLVLPPEPELIAMARMFAAAVARHFWCDEEDVDDVKIAISEACTSAVKAHQADATTTPIRVVAREHDATLEFAIEDVVSSPASLRASGTTSVQGLMDGTLGIALIRSLFPGAAVEGNEAGGSTVRFAVAVGTATD